MDQVLFKKKILFISGGFYNYDKIITEQLEIMGAKVTYYCSAPTKNHTLMRIYQRFSILKELYCNKLYHDIADEEFDYIFMLNTARLTDDFVKSISYKYKKAKKILYCWDAIKTIPEVKNRIQYFDAAFTFDTGDAIKYKNMHHLPLFYSTPLKNAETVYDFSFVGFGHSNRYQFIQNIKSYADARKLSYNFKLFLPSILYYFRGKYLNGNLKGSKKTDFIYKSLTDTETSDIMSKSRIILDYEVGSQDGLTMRTIEALGAHKKIITTNKNIRMYDFYNKHNILIVNRENPIIPDEFIESDYEVLPSEIYDRYRLENWLLYMFMFDEDNTYMYADMENVL